MTLQYYVNCNCEKKKGKENDVRERKKKNAVREKKTRPSQ